MRLLSFCQTISGGFCRNYILHVRSNISKKTIFFGKKQLPRDFDNKRRYCGSVVESFSLRFKKLYAMFPEEQFEKNIFSKKPCFLIFLGHWAEIISLFWMNILDVVIKTAFYVFRGSFWEILLRSRFFILFRILSEKVLALYRKTFSGKIKTWICVSTGLFEKVEENFYFRKCFSLHGTLLERKNFCLLAKSFRKFCKNLTPPV